MSLETSTVYEKDTGNEENKRNREKLEAIRRKLACPEEKREKDGTTATIRHQDSRKETIYAKWASREMARDNEATAECAQVVKSSERPNQPTNLFDSETIVIERN